MGTKWLLIIPVIAIFGCKKGKDITPAPAIAPPVILLKDIEEQNLPSPYYHFEYNADSSVSLVSFAAEFKKYQVSYASGKINELRDSIGGLAEKIQYFYDIDGKVSMVYYVDLSGNLYVKVYFTYQGNQLTKLERQRKLGSDFVVNKTLSFSYYPDGNVKLITDNRPAITGVQVESTTTDLFEQYDTGRNVDGFTLIHNDFFDHLILLPAVVFQKNNPLKESVTSDTFTYSTTNVYTYNDRKLPSRKDANVIFTSGANAGQSFQSATDYSYY